MKMFTNREQTAKLIELGFEKPQSEDIIIDERGVRPISVYSIGELIEILTTIKGVRISFDSMFGGRPTLIVKRLVDDKWDILYGKVENELVDLLFDAIVKLKEEGVLSTPQPQPKRTIVDFYECKACGRRLMIQQGLPHDVCPNCDSTQIERISLKKAMGEDEDN